MSDWGSYAGGTDKTRGAWHMFTLVDSGNSGSTKLYVDGVLVSTNAEMYGGLH